MESALDVKNGPYYNLRKRYGKETARKILSHWLDYHVDHPQTVDQALRFYTIGDDCP